MNTTIFKKMSNPKFIGSLVIIVIVIIVIIVIVLNLKSSDTISPQSEALKAIKAKSIITATPVATISAPPSDAKPWCTEITYTFTVSGSTGNAILTVPANITSTFPRIKLTENGATLKADTLINVEKNMSLKGVKLPPVLYKYNNMKIGDSVKDKYELTSEGIFIDYENPCGTSFQFGFEAESSPFRPSIKLSTENNSDNSANLNAGNEYTVTFFTKSNVSGPTVKIVYFPNPVISLQGAISGYSKPVFIIRNIYGKEGLRITRKDNKILKEQYKEHDPALVDFIENSPGVYTLIDKNPLRQNVSQLKAVFNNFNTSFI